MAPVGTTGEDLYLWMSAKDEFFQVPLPHQEKPDLLMQLASR